MQASPTICQPASPRIGPVPVPNARSADVHLVFQERALTWSSSTARAEIKALDVRAKRPDRDSIRLKIAGKGSNPVAVQRGETMDTILLVGLVVRWRAEIFLAMDRIDRSTMPDRRRRLLNYTLLRALPLALFFHRYSCHRRQCLNPPTVRKILTGMPSPRTKRYLPARSGGITRQRR